MTKTIQCRRLKCGAWLVTVADFISVRCADFAMARREVWDNLAIIEAVGRETKSEAHKG